MKLNLTRRVTGSFLLLSLLSLGVVGGIAFWRARDALKQAALDRLEVTATLKEEEINRWFADQREDFLLITRFPDIQMNLKILLGIDGSKKGEFAYTILSSYLREVVQLKPNFQEIVILDRSNRIILSTARKRERQYEVLANITYVERDRKEETFAPIFYVSSLTGKPSVTLAIPLQDSRGQRQGIFLAHLNLERVDRIVRERAGLGKSGETYLIGSLVTKNTFISRENKPDRSFPDGVRSPGIDRSMAGERGSGLYTNYAGIPVIGVYRWLDRQDLALLVEMHQNEAFAPARQLAVTIVLVGAVSVGGLMLGILALSRQLTLSRGQLEEYSHRLEEKAVALQREIQDRGAIASLLQATFESIQDGILAVDRSGNMINYNRRFLEIWAIPPEVLAEPRQEKRIAYLANQIKDPEEFIERVQQLYDTPEAYSYDLLELRDGRVFERHSGPQRLDNRITGRIWTFRDITDRRQREEALRLIVEGTASATGQEFFRSLVRYLAEILQVRYALVARSLPEKPGWVRALAYWQGDGFGESFDYDLVGTPCEKLQEGESYFHPRRIVEAFPDNLLIATLELESYWGFPLVNPSGNVLGHLTVFDDKTMAEDITRELILKLFAARAGAELERVIAGEELEKAKNHAEAANRAKTQFLANMSHELRTPLNAILGFAQLMERDGSLSDQGHESLGIINRSGEHLLNLINDVLEMSKIEAGRTALNRSPFNLPRLLQTLQEMFCIRAEAKGISLAFDLDADLPRYIDGDEGKLRQVLINLLGNAVKFTATGRVIGRVRKTSENGTSCQVQFEVEDTGRGIEAADIDTIFNPFVQTAIGDRAEGGTGLGLAISRQFVQLMGGDIEVKSTPGRGSIFSFALPLTLAPTPVIASLPSVLKIASDGRDYRILVVDDQEENRQLLERLLTPVGFEARSATNGQEAIDLWREWRPHLIWMDMRMPVMDGYEATRRIKSEPRGKETIIIALTASAFDEQRAAILAIGCDDMVSKPFSESVIFEKMAFYLGVRYLYGESPVDRPHREILELRQLQIMPPEWIRELQRAAIEVDAVAIERLIERIPATEPALARELSRLTRDYDFDAILELTEQVEEGN